jgi:hypothetical protein
MIQVKIIDDNPIEPITLNEAKAWLQVDYSDFDNLISMLISACREKSEQMSGLAYYPKLVEVTGNEKTDKVYPIQPFVSDEVWADEDENIDYRYNAGLERIPQGLKVAMLNRIATGFAYRQNGINEAINAVLNQSYTYELQYRQDITIT